MANNWMLMTKVISCFLLSAVFIGAPSIGANPLTQRNREGRDVQKEIAAAFAARLENRIANSAELQEALGSSVECLEEITALIIADLALQQAQHDRDVAGDALDKCIMSLPDPPPGPDPDPMPSPVPEPMPEVRPNGEYSVLVR